MGNPFVLTVMRQTPVPANHGLQVMLVLAPLTSRSLLRRASLVSPRFSLLRRGVSTTSYSRSDISPEAHDCSSLTRLQGKPFEFQMPFGSYIMENVLFKISYPAEFHAQTAVEAAHTIHRQLKAAGKSSDDIKSVRIRTQEAAIRIIDKQGPLDNFADREYAIPNPCYDPEFAHRSLPQPCDQLHGCIPPHLW